MKQTKTKYATILMNSDEVIKLLKMVIDNKNNSGMNFLHIKLQQIGHNPINKTPQYEIDITETKRFNHLKNY